MDNQTIFIVGVVIVLLILVIDGIRRMRNASPRYQQRLYEKNKVEVDESTFDLPNGGSRKVKNTQDEFATDDDSVDSPMTHIKGIADLEQDLDEYVPVLMDSVAHEQLADNDELEGDSERQTSLDLNETIIDQDDVLLQSSEYSFNSDSEDSKNDLASSADHNNEAVTSAVDDTKSDINEESGQSQESKAKTAQDVLVLNITSNSDNFSGLELYHAMIAGGLRFGDMNIFHSSNQQGQIQFSLINSVQPGTFDLESINQFNTPGVSMFMQLPCEVDAITAFEQMKNVAHFLATELNGQVRDDAQNRLTDQSTEQYRDRIRQFQRTQQLEQA
ncbi:MAG: cell division protein ZipA [Saccharospirillaceae bacterium]|nr:cell division protein ZipA [Saccharospirillaceae bacterium]